MPKPFPILTTVVAASACAALVCAQEVSTADNRIAAASPTAGERQPDENKPAASGSGAKPSSTVAAEPKPSSASAPATVPSGEASAESTPKPKKSFLGWLFGSRKKKNAATPAPTAEVTTPKPGATPHKSTGARKPSGTPEIAADSTPKPGKTTPTPKATPAGKATPTPKTTPALKATPTPKATNAKPGKPEATPKPEKPAATPKPEKISSTTPVPNATSAPRKSGKTKPEANATAPVDGNADVDAEAKEKAHFEAAKAKALDDAQVKSLKAKADGALTEEESKTALRNYNKALFQKIKKIDPSVSEWSDRMEAAILKRLSE